MTIWDIYRPINFMVIVLGQTDQNYSMQSAEKIETAHFL